MASGPISEFLQNIRRAALQSDETGRSDGQLLDAYVRTREETAFAALVHRHGPMVWGVCCRVLGDKNDAEDAFQATFLVLVRKAASVVPREQIANWLYGVARQTAVKARAMAVKRKSREKQVKDMPEPAVAEQRSSEDLLPLLDQELGRLPDKYRTAIVLCDLEGKSYKEAARQLGCPEGTLAARLTRGRAMLAKRLARHGLAVTGGALAQAASASVPASVVSSTIRAATLFAAGTAAATGAISVKVAALTEGVLKSMLLTKLKIVTAILIVASTAAFTCGVWAMRQQPSSLGDGNAKAQTKPADSPKEDKNKLQGKRRQLAIDNKHDAKLLDGNWKVIALEEGGRKAPSEVLKGMHWTFKGSEVEMVDPKPAPGAKASMKLDWNKTPKHIDLVILEGGGASKGKTVQGIFTLERDRLIICLRDPENAEKGRPTEFKTEKGSGLGIITLERDPPSKKDEQWNFDLEEGNKTKLQALLKERVEILRQNVERIKRLHEQGAAGPDAVRQANLRLYKAELDLCETPKDRIAVLEKTVKVYKEIEDQLSQLIQKGVATQEVVRDAKLDRLEAEIALEREKAKLAPQSK